MRSRGFLFWLLVGSLAGVILQIGQARAMGGVAEGLLFAGTWQEVHTFVVDELPHTPVFEGFGHDGQIFYAVGLDLRGEWVPDTLLSAAYRYRRILYPALSSGFGVLDGAPLLWGMILLSSLPIGVAAGAVARIGEETGLPWWAPVAVLLNPGTWLSARLLTSDNLALALGMLAVLAFLKRRNWWAALALGAAALTKEPSIAFALGLGGYAWFAGDRKNAVRLLSGGFLPLAIWWTYISVAIGNPLESGGNVAAPLVGLATSISIWPVQEADDWFYLATTLAGTLAAVWVLIRGPRLWAWLVAPWLLIGVLSSNLVWHLGNNAARAFSPVVTLGVLGVLATVDSRRSVSNATAPSTSS